MNILLVWGLVCVMTAACIQAGPVDGKDVGTNQARLKSKIFLNEIDEEGSEVDEKDLGNDAEDDGEIAEKLSEFASLIKRLKSKKAKYSDRANIYNMELLGSHLDFMYVETRTIDNQASYYENFAKFINDNKIPHVALGLLDVESNKPICDVIKDSLFVKHFFLKLQAGVKISAHPYDGFGNTADGPTRYKKWSGLDAVVHYMTDMNSLLKSLGSHVLFTGMVLGESMSGKPFQNDVATVKLFREKLAGVGLSNCTLGASPGGPDIGLDEFYKQVYDWTPYGPENPNFWITYKNDPQSFFKALENPKVHRGWSVDKTPPIPPWSETKNYYNDNNHLWKWQIPEPGKGLHWMWARSVPQGDHKRLIAWTWNGVSDFYAYTKKQISTRQATGKVALYLDDGLQAFW